MMTLYGIKNCDTVKKARTWLKNHDIPYEFHNFKKDGVSKDLVVRAFAVHGWETVINQRGTTWREVPKKIQKNMDEAGALTLAIENPSVIKRPLLVMGKDMYIGFNDTMYCDIFKIEKTDHTEIAENKVVNDGTAE